MTRQSAEYAIQRPPTYTSERQHEPPPSSLSHSPSESESLVSAPSRPSSPLPYDPIPQEPMNHYRPRSTLPYPSPQAAALAGQGYIITTYPDDVPTRTRPLPIPSSAPESVDSEAVVRPPTSPVKLQRTLSRSHPIVSVNATNYASIMRKTPHHRKLLSFNSATSSIKGSFTVDPFLHIPAELLPPLNIRKNETEADRKNLRLEVENGGIDVDIHLVGELAPSFPSPAPRTTLSLGLAGGSRDSTFPIVARIHTPTVTRPPFHLTAKATNGLVSVHLPRSFHGLVVVSVTVGNLNSHISLSSGMLEQMTILNETAQTRSYFVGRMGDWSKLGDKAELIVYGGKVAIQYDDELVRKRGWSIFG
ncbi:hypothetical protein BDZ89DRAFT_734983 [Hymenopellis radicata]|nr:hypothetical protein BDZ89DRAFT_734983 [Hymenopellis radicata]